MRLSTLITLGTAAVAQAAVYQGFNYGSTFTDGSVKQQQDFQNEFNRAKNLQGTSGFTAARLFTMIQGGTTNTITAAIPAAINTQTSLLLGLWGSAGQADFNNELTALSNAINQYGTAFTSLIVGISVGSEDLYRVSPTGIENNSGAGATPDEIVSYINQVRNAIKGTAASSATVGHVDTWTAWVNGSNSAVIQAVDWLGTDAYPYFQTTESNGIDVGASLFFDAYNATVGVAGGKAVWITETGWPVSGPNGNDAVPSTANAETYWQQVACRVLGNINTFWYTLQDAYPTTPSPSFGIIGTDLNSAPLYDLTCSNGNNPSSSSTPSSSVPPASSASSPAPPASPSTQAASSSIVTTPQVQPSPSSVTLPTTSQPAAPNPPASSGCPTNLNGEYQFPHLIVPVDSSNPNTAYGTSYNGKINPTVSSIFNFDIPSSYAGKTCSLVFLFPTQSQLETSSFTFNGKGGIEVSELSGPATGSTTYNSVPAAAGSSQTINGVAPGNSYSVFTHECGAGQRIGFKFASVGGLDLDYFQDYNPSPIGAYITVC